MQKKGMSPLIATVLLIAFAVALGAMIMNWSSDLQPGSGGELPGDACQSARIELNEVFGKQIFCYEEGNIRFNLVNTGSVEVQGIQLRTVDADLKEVKQDLTGSGIAVGDTFDATVPFDKSSKVHVELVPRVVEDGSEQLCLQRRIIQDVLPDCSN